MGSETKPDSDRIFLPSEVEQLRQLLDGQRELHKELGEEYDRVYTQLQTIGQRKSTAELRIATLQNVLYVFSTDSPRSANVYED